MQAVSGWGCMSERERVSDQVMCGQSRSQGVYISSKKMEV